MYTISEAQSASFGRVLGALSPDAKQLEHEKPFTSI
jgi:hypothetical protein